MQALRAASWRELLFAFSLLDVADCTLALYSTTYMVNGTKNVQFPPLIIFAISQRFTFLCVFPCRPLYCCVLAYRRSLSLMNDSVKYALQLQRTADGFVHRAEGHEDLRISEKAIKNSKTLKYALDESEDGDVVPIGIEHQMLVDWHGFASQENGDGSRDVPTLMRILKVIFPELILQSCCTAGTTGRGQSSPRHARQDC